MEGNRALTVHTSRLKRRRENWCGKWKVFISGMGKSRSRLFTLLWVVHAGLCSFVRLSCFVIELYMRYNTGFAPRPFRTTSVERAGSKITLKHFLDDGKQGSRSLGCFGLVIFKRGLCLPIPLKKRNLKAECLMPSVRISNDEKIKTSSRLDVKSNYENGDMKPISQHTGADLFFWYFWVFRFMPSSFHPKALLPWTEPVSCYLLACAGNLR